MKPTIQTIKIFVALILMGATHIAMGSFTGSSEGRSKQFSLKEFNKTFYRTPSANPFSLKAGFEYKGSKVFSSTKTVNGTTVTSVMKFQRGNTTYLYPYKHKVNVPKFSTPAPPAIK